MLFFGSSRPSLSLGSLLEQDPEPQSPVRIMAYTPSSLPEEQVFTCLKGTLRGTLDGEELGKMSHEESLDRFTGFYVAVAEQKERLSPSAVAGAARTLWGLSPKEAKQVGHCLASTLAWARRRFKRGVLQLGKGEQLVHNAWSRQEDPCLSNARSSSCSTLVASTSSSSFSGPADSPRAAW